MMIIADTEDDSKECLEDGRSGFEKEVTQIAALGTDGSSFHNRGDVIEFVRWLQGKQRQHGKALRVYFHNLRYDLGNLFGRALDAPDVQLVGGRMIHARLGKLVFFDSFNMWPMSVAKLGKAFGLEKLSMDIRSKDYVFRDCEIVKRALEFTQGMVAEFDIETLPATIGGLAVRIWRNMGGETWFDDSELCREAYYGGRVELFRTHAEGSINYYDVNSLYPYAMAKAFPTHLEPQADIDCEGIACAEVQAAPDFVSALPVRRQDGSIYYPCGRLSGLWTCAELRCAVANGRSRILKILAVSGSRETFSPYAEFIGEFYKRRQRCTSDAEKLFYKLLLNNLYGQQAMNGMVTRSVFKRGTRRGVPYGNKELVDVQMPLPEHVNYCHAAHVTSYARIHLLEHLRKVPWKDLIYCDTDSIICLGNHFKTGNELGQMKLEAKWNYAITHAPKVYEGTGVVKAKGVPVKHARDFIDHGQATFAVPFGFREAIRGYDQSNKNQLSVWRNVTKQKRTNYDKKRLEGVHWFPIEFSAP